MHLRFLPLLFIAIALFIPGGLTPPVVTPSALAVAPAAPDSGPWIFVYPAVIEITHTAPPETTFETITIENSSPEFIFYSLHVAGNDCTVPDAPVWLLPNSGGGSLPPFSLDIQQLTITSDGLTNGVYTALVCIQDTAHPQNPYHQVFVQLTVAAPETPTPEPPTSTPEPPTATPEPPTATPEIPTATPDIPTATPDVPTPTPELPSPTPELPTVTPSNTPPPGATLTPTSPPATNTPVVEATVTITNTPAPFTHHIYLPLARRR